MVESYSLELYKHSQTTYKHAKVEKWLQARSLPSLLSLLSTFLLAKGGIMTLSPSPYCLLLNLSLAAASWHDSSSQLTGMSHCTSTVHYADTRCYWKFVEHSSNTVKAMWTRHSNSCGTISQLTSHFPRWEECNWRTKKIFCLLWIFIKLVSWGS